MKLWHCRDARSLRPLWALKEMGLAYDLIILPFPPRVYQKDYLALNPLGTVPYFVDGPVRMTESSAICHYLVEKYRRYDFGLQADHDHYGAYLNWLYQSDATLTFPQTIYLRYSQLEPPERRLPQAAEDYRKWFMARLRMLDDHLTRQAYLCDHRFTIADITVGYALFLGENLGLADDYQPQTRAYLARLKERPGFQAARRAQEAA
jgi:glutathione S-transferase